MSVQQNPEKAVSTLRKLLYKARDLSDEPIDESIDNMLQKLEIDLSGIKAWENNLVVQFNEMRLLIYKNLTHAKNEAGGGIKGDLRLVEDKIKKLNVALQPPNLDLGINGLKPQGWRSRFEEASEKKLLREWKERGVEKIIYQTPAMLDLQASYYTLEKLELKLCFLFFSVFPENAIIKKRSLIYWWIGEGLIAGTAKNKTAEEEGESIFQELIELELIVPYHEIPDKPRPVVNACKMHPWLRHVAISLAQEAQLFDFDSSGIPSYGNSKCRHECLVLGGHNTSAFLSPNVENLLSVFNVSEKFIDLNPDWLSKLKKIEVLQLGAWHNSRKHHHIEVIKEKVLRGLGALKHLKYLSLRGISLITTLPSSIGELLALEILDLKACQNLKKLPSKIGSLTRLTHLDVSECPFIESMPKELQNLTNLQVLKGFVIGNSKTSCKIDDIVNLKELRRLGILIGTKEVAREGEFTKLKDFEKLHSLTVWWVVKKSGREYWKPSKGKSKKLGSLANLSFPQNLEKLDLRGTPEANPPKELKPSALKKLKKLYIRGGKITKLDGGEKDQQWNVEILRLKYLEDFKLNWKQLRLTFPRLGYLDVKCDKQKEDGKYKEDFVSISISEMHDKEKENLEKEEKLTKNVMPAENESLGKDTLGKKALVNKGKGKKVRWEIMDEASTS